MSKTIHLQPLELAIAALFSLGLLAYHLVLSTQSYYGYFIDELYYIACSHHLAFGYVDHPPLSILLLAASRRLLGESLPALRLMPALAMAVTTFTACMITNRLGGTRSAVVLTSLAVIANPVCLVMGSFFSMNAFEIAFCVIIVYFTLRMLQDENPHYWVPIGVMLGLGLELKHTSAIYGLAIVIGMLLTPARRLLWSRWFVWGMLSCFLLLLPNLVWQAVHGFPSLEFYRNAMVNKNIQRTPFGVLLDQAIFANPFALPLWVAGLVYLLVSKHTQRYRSLGWLFPFLLLFMVLSGSSRPDRIAAIYPFLFAAGAVAIQSIQWVIMRWVATGLMVVVLVAGILVCAPVFSPLLPPAATQKYISAFGLSLSIESGKTNDPLPQWLGDRLGWHELASEVSRVYRGLSPEEQRNAVIISTNYGGAGALELYGKEYGLPPVFATHNSYHLWGPPSDTVKTYIGVFVNRRDLEQRFESVQEAAVQTCEYCTRPQQKIPIYVARGPKFSVAAEWPKIKIYN